ncbi:S49 family peptidase [Pseudomonas gingeri]|uniref:S49 family peptidase n=1 Tax=Pseudomonas gingeri TaxID=117681 RepID=UPI0015BC1A09|nr:S49 family peptidase [Pseudomonas gingeri]NWD49027.1 S49 family peptidase [Pseudomonas gingeri]
MPRAFELASAQPWLMLPDALDNLMSIADRQGDPEALEARLGKALDNTRSVTMRNGVAIIPVTGPIFRYANMFTRISGATSTAVLATDLQTALDDPKVKAIVLQVDSPGGEANGINELADMIHSARDKKRIVSYVGGSGASAAYWLASAASEVIVDDTALLGSIGVVLNVSVTKDDGGKKSYEIVSSTAPNKRPNIETEEGRAEIAKTVDALADVFVSKVARNLGVSADKVPEMGGHGGLKVGADAVASGLAHRVGSLESVIAELAGPASNPLRKPNVPTIVKTTAELHAAIQAGADPLTIEVSAPDPTAQQAAITDAQASATAAERERYTGITALASAGFEAEIKTALEDGSSVEATALLLYKAAKDRGISLTSIKNDSTAAAAAASAAGKGAPGFSTKAIWNSRKGSK